MSRGLEKRVLPVAAWALIAVAVGMRCWSLGNLPGVNGDEAWYGVQAERLVHGEIFDGRTPTGNTLNPFFFWPQVALHRLFEPSFELLRSVAVASGLAALVVNYLLCRREFGRRVAAISTVVLAVLPVNIVYSRLAWDPSQTLLFSLPVIYWPLRAIKAPAYREKWTVCSLVALAAAILVHPTNVFLTPVMAIALAVAWKPEVTIVWQRWGRGAGLLAAALLLATICGAGLMMPERAQAAATRLATPDQYAQMLGNVVSLLSGSGPLEYVAGHTDVVSMLGRPLSWLLIDLVALTVVTSVAIGTWQRYSLSSRPAEACLAIGLLLSLAAFFVVAGPDALGPHYQRYGLWVIAPVAILIALNVGARSGVRSGLLISPIMGLALGVFCLAAVYQHFFVTLHQSGGESHYTFRTAQTEPKLSAMQFLVNDKRIAPDPFMVVNEWWNYWPLEYLSYASQFHVLRREFQNPWHDMTSRYSLSIRFAGQDRPRPDARQIVVIRDAAGRELLWLFIPRHETPKNFLKKLKSTI